MNNSFILHAIVDIFGRKISPIYYGRNFDIVESCHSNEHSMGCVGMHSDFPQIRRENYYFLNIDEETLHSYIDYSDFLFSINYKYEIDPPYCDRVSKLFKIILKEKAQVLLVNPGTWSYCFDDYFERSFYLEREIKRYSMFRSEKVFVYENI